MKLASLTDEELWMASLQKTRKGTATAEAKRAAQILYTRNITHGGFGGGVSCAIPSHLDYNPERKWKRTKHNMNDDQNKKILLYKYGIPLGTGPHDKPLNGLTYAEDGDLHFQCYYLYRRELTALELKQYPLTLIGRVEGVI